MSCCGQREKLGKAREEQKWDYINLSDFRSTTCFTPLSYGILYLSLIISVTVYGVDIFTAANLLFFDRWSGQVKPVIPFYISRWIFAACILLSWILLVCRWVRAARVMRSGVIAANYLDPLAVMMQSVRTGRNGRGWRRFLVFAELTKGRKGTEYVALFTYFSFEAWLRIIFAEGPRQVINALTLYSVMQANLVPVGNHKASHGHTPIVQFFLNVQILANSNREQAAILFSMLFTLMIWVVSALSLLVAVLFYLLFLYHHIPNKDNGLSNYCRRKMDSRLQKIVGVKVNQALAKVDPHRKRSDPGPGGPGGRPHQIVRQPTLPMLDTDLHGKGPKVPSLSRQTTQSTLPLYNSRQSSPNDNPLNLSLSSNSNFLEMYPPSYRQSFPSRSITQSFTYSSASYASNVPLMREAAGMGYVPASRNYTPAPPSRTGTSHSTNSSRSLMNQSLMASSQGMQRSYHSAWKPPPVSLETTPSPAQTQPPSRQNTDLSAFGSWESRAQSPMQTPAHSSITQDYPIDTYRRRTPGAQAIRENLVQDYEIQPQRPVDGVAQHPTHSEGYIAFNPNTHAAQSAISRQQSFPVPASLQPPTRNFTMPIAPYQNLSPQPLQPQPALPQRSGTAPIPSYNGFSPVSYPISAKAMPPRAATAGPNASGWRKPS